MTPASCTAISVPSGAAPLDTDSVLSGAAQTDSGPSRTAQPGADTTRRRLGDVLMDHGLVLTSQLEDALGRQAMAAAEGRKVRLGQLLVEAGFVSERELAAAMAELLQLDVVDLGSERIDFDAARLIPRTVAERAQVLVLGHTDRGLRVAAADPTNVIALDDVKLLTGAAELTVVVATKAQLLDHLANVWSLSESSGELSTMFEPEVEARTAEEISVVDDAPVVRLVNSILYDAVQMRASDIHIEPQQGTILVRYRVDGLLREVMTLPRSAGAGLVSRVKIISGLDIAERRVPQDGRVRLPIGSGAVDARVSTLPSVHGEKIVIRLLANADSVAPLEKIGLAGRQIDDVLAALQSPQGLILITGPTGSGKTNTLYSAIHEIRSPECNIVTLEDPVEIQLPGITQVHVNQRTGLTFSRGLRAILRQDPDVVLVGEVRDAETAELALHAAMTGHLVLTTLHTNDALSSMTRLVDIGVEPFLVASSVSLVVAQRLVRKPCSSCAEPYTPDPKVLAKLGLTPGDLEGGSPMKGRGCNDCGDTGYRGRTGVFEVVPVTSSLRAALGRGASERDLEAIARDQGILSLRRAAIDKAISGETTFDEVLRVSAADAPGGNACTSCERHLDEDMVVCPWCDIELRRGRCSGCARPLDAEWKVCPWCREHADRAVVQDLPLQRKGHDGHNARLEATG
jgi:type IV pilus assembly protein PilB